ncbi:MAG: acyl-CoA carboxylase subunit beta [Oligoflexales bacterium]|nr:acyl-CoA carboxylase subunit beta [Oligoflexales bacterium]
MQNLGKSVLKAKREEARTGGGEKKIKTHHDQGKLTARERIHLLFDPGSFLEIDAFVVHDGRDFGIDKSSFLGDGAITGWGLVDGRTVYAYAQDFTIFGGSLSAAQANKICKIMKLAIQNGAPIVGLNDSGGARIHEGVASLAGYADIFYLNVQASGVIPQLSLMLGPCAGGAVYSPALTDCIFMVDKTSHMFITGPHVVKAVTGEQVSFEQLGGAKTHTRKSGVVDLRFPSEEELILGAKKWLSYVPSNNLDEAPSYPSPEDSSDQQIQDQLVLHRKQIETILPDNPNLPYNMKELVSCLVDPESLWEMKPEFAPNLFTGLARLAGQSIGIVANNPQHMAGVLDISASVKGARFVRFCDAFHIPLLTLVDVPGFYPGQEQEEGGIIRHGAKLLYAYCEATVPKLTVITRKAYGGAYNVMGSKHIGADLNLAWPTAEIAVMGAEAASQIIFKREIQGASDPALEKQKHTQAYAKKFATPYIAASKGYVDAVVFPSETRSYLIRALKACSGKRTNTPKRKHGNIPL